MSEDNILIVKLTGEQQKQIKDATDKTITTLSIDVAGLASLSDEDLEQVTGGITSQSLGGGSQGVPKG